MSNSCRRALAATAALLVPAVGLCVDLADDRIAFSANGTSLDSCCASAGGGGASLGWLHNFDPDTLIGLGGEHERLGVSHWSFASLNGAMTRGSGDARYTLYGEAHEGAGSDGGKSFHYLIEALGVTGTYFHRLSLTVEDKQFNVESTNGNLPKVQAAYLWNPHFQTTVAYAHSFGGNLGSHLTFARIDGYFAGFNAFAGGAIGQASPSVLNLAFTAPPEKLREGYIGLSKNIPQWRSDLTLTLDYQHLSGGYGTTTALDSHGNPILDDSGNEIKTPFFIPPNHRWTGTLAYVFHIGHHGNK